MSTASSLVTRSPGVNVGYLITVGNGQRGLTDSLDSAVQEAAEALAEQWSHEVTIRFNSDRLSGGVWVKTSAEDRLWANAEVGITYWTDRETGEIQGPGVLLNPASTKDHATFEQSAASILGAIRLIAEHAWTTSGAELAARIEEEKKAGVVYKRLWLDETPVDVVCKPEIVDGKRSAERWTIHRADETYLGLLIHDKGLWSGLGVDGNLVGQPIRSSGVMLDCIARASL